MTDWGEYASYYIARLLGPDALAAWHSLVEADDAIIPVLVEAYHVQTDPTVRAELVEIICEHRLPETVGFLSAVLRGPAPYVWKAALDGLVTLEGHSALRVLRSARGDPHFRGKAGRLVIEWTGEAIDQMTKKLATEAGLMKPQRLQLGDRAAAITLSWGGPAAAPQRYEVGKQQLHDEFGLQVVETPNALRDPDWVWRNPQARADDLMGAFADPSIKAVISTIGGDDSIRILRHLDLDVIRGSPKVFLGYSDTTVTHLACYKAGLVSFYGPAIMAGFGENCGMFPYMVGSVRRTLFCSDPVGTIAPNTQGWTAEFLDWADPANQSRPRKLNPSTGWRFLQGEGAHRGHLIGGGLEVLDWLRGTDLWPGREAWRGAILFLETSEDAPPPARVRAFLRSCAAMGILEELAGVLFGRPGGNVPPEKFVDYDQAILQVVSDEESLTNLPVVTQMDFGHTDPMFVLPYGVQAEIDCDEQRFAIVESAVAD